MGVVYFQIRLSPVLLLRTLVVIDQRISRFVTWLKLTASDSRRDKQRSLSFRRTTQFEGKHDDADISQTHWMLRVYFYDDRARKISEKWEMIESPFLPVFAMIEPSDQGR